MSKRTTEYMPLNRDNFAEWAPDRPWLATEADMGSTERRFEGAIGRGDARKTVEIGQFIYVVPEGMTPRECIEREENGEEVYDLREVLKVGWDNGEQKFLFACRGYLRADSTEYAGRFDDDDATKSLKKCAGGDLEFIRTITTDYIWETRIARLVNAAALDPSSRDFKTLDVRQPFFRTDLELNREWSGDRWRNWRATKHPHSCCTHKCTLGRVYVPHHDEMRWCGLCGAWVHVACQKLKVGGGQAFNLEHARRWTRTQNECRWFYVSAIRVARNPGRPNLRHTTIVETESSSASHPAIPYTIEKTLLHLKEARLEFLHKHEQFPDFKTYVRNYLTASNLEPPNELLVKEITDVIDQAPEQLWYECTACGRRV
ncbi:hypothetical protein GSI_11987 [Ganoderma sinense ZZ0214-1]|uniref:Uncharacterized protein n=1 Tax=Ganoderma sinense ZZ0214-1 TaxID=1077348 RepID=A0A2G8RXJ9_9APHY|nr:hypothetical protein GSI_11987 [Ganoderma sinense ZZ0214-1]